MSENNKKLSGFTLIELLVVIAIIGIISSSIMATLTTVRSDARDVRRNQDVIQIITALELYFHKHGNFPCVGSSQNSDDPDFLEPLVDEGFLSIKPDDPIGDDGDSYRYEYLSYKNTPGGQCGQVAYIGTYTESTMEPGGLSNGWKAGKPTSLSYFLPRIT